ncbi:MAG: phosphotransferase family protein [Dehalococcoidia bacterium]|nr:phosphotransferase family protein [Dehalococcoidia bacterium]
MVQRTDPQAKRERLEAWLSNKLPSAESVTVSELVKAAGGYGSEIHFFDASWREGGQESTEQFVIREEPKVFRVFPEYNLAREYETMKSLQDSDVPVPRLFWLETDESVLGAPFYVMEKVDGEVLDPQQFGDEPGGPLYKASPEGRHRMCCQGIEIMARINTVDCADIGLSYAGAPESSADAIDKQMSFYRRMADWAEVQPRSLLDGAFEWFDKNRFEPGHMSLCWGDARLGNLLYRDGEIAAVIDWDMSHIGIAETDLAWFLALNWLTNESGLRGERWEGLPGREETVRIYENALGRKLENLFYHEAFAFLRLGIIFWRVVKSIPGIPPEYIPENPPLSRLADMLDLEYSV